jgi:hypothetical protein
VAALAGLVRADGAEDRERDWQKRAHVGEREARVGDGEERQGECRRGDHALVLAPQASADEEDGDDARHAQEGGEEAAGLEERRGVEEELGEGIAARQVRERPEPSEREPEQPVEEIGERGRVAEVLGVGVVAETSARRAP